MAIRYFLGKSGSGKTTELYNEIINDSIARPTENFILIVPEQYTLTGQLNIVKKHPKHGSCNIDVLSFDRLGYAIFEELGIGLGKHLDDVGKDIILKKVIYEQAKNLKVYKSKKDKLGFARQIQSIISEFAQYKVFDKSNSDILERTKELPFLHDKLSDIKIINDAFNKEIEGKYMTKDMVTALLCDVIEKSEIVKNSNIYFDGFTGYVPIQLDVIEKLMVYAKNLTFAITLKKEEYPFEKVSDYELFSLSKNTIIAINKLARENNVECLDSLVFDESRRHKQGGMLEHLEKNLFIMGKTMPYEADYSNEISVTVADNPKEECEYIAKNICRLIRDEKNEYKYSDIAVVASDLQKYDKYLQEMFLQYDIPAFVDVKKSVLDNPFVDSLSAVLNIVETNYSYDSVFHYLKRDMSGISKDDVFKLENYVLAAGIRGRKKWCEDFQRDLGMKEEELAHINKLRKIFFEQVDPIYEKIKERSSTVEDITRVLYEFCERLDFQGRLQMLSKEFAEKGENLLAFEYEKVYKIVMDLFDHFVSLLGSEKCGTAKFNDIFCEGLSSTFISLIPPVSDQVMVGDIERSRVDDIKVLFVCGVNEELILTSSEGNSIISEQDRRELSKKQYVLAPDNRKNVAIKRFYIYNCFLKPADKLVISYPKTSSTGEAMTPSSVIGIIKDLYLKLKEGDAVLKSDEPFAIEEMYNQKIALNKLSKTREMYEYSDIWQLVWNLLLADGNKDMLDMIMSGKNFWKHDKGLTEDVAQQLFTLKHMIGITSLEKYANCPYGQFLNNGLDIRARREQSFSAIELGQLYHDTLEQFCVVLRKNNLTWHEMDEEKRNVFVDEAFKNAISLAESRGNIIETNYAKIVNSRVRTSIDFVTRNIKKQIDVGKFEPEYFEYKTKHGRIDRIDVYEDEGRVYFRIVDYKSGSTSYDLVKVYANLQMQLFAYLNDAQEDLAKKHKGKEIIPVGAYYLKTGEQDYLEKNDFVSNGSVDVEALDSKRFLGNKLDGDTSIETMSLVVSDGIFENNPPVDSSVIKVSYTQKGEVSKKSKVRTGIELDRIKSYVKDSTDRLTNDVLCGKNERHPFKYKDKTGCDYCEFSGICNFCPPFNKKDKYNEIKLKESDVIDLLMSDENDKDKEED